MMKSASVREVLTVDGGIVAGSTMTFAGSVTFNAKVTAASDFNTSGCVQVGAAGTDIFQILAGSVAASTPVINASATGYASALVTGLTTNHKVFVSPSAMSGSLFIYEAFCDGACAALRINLLAAENVAEDTGAVFSYLAIRDA
jgi:hypothetical protein